MCLLFYLFGFSGGALYYSGELDRLRVDFCRGWSWISAFSSSPYPIVIQRLDVTGCDEGVG